MYPIEPGSPRERAVRLFGLLEDSDAERSLISSSGDEAFVKLEGRIHHPIRGNRDEMVRAPVIGESPRFGGHRKQGARSRLQSTGSSSFTRSRSCRPPRLRNSARATARPEVRRMAESSALPAALRGKKKRRGPLRHTRFDVGNETWNFTTPRVAGSRNFLATWLFRTLSGSSKTLFGNLRAQIRKSANKERCPFSGTKAATFPYTRFFRDC